MAAQPSNRTILALFSPELLKKNWFCLWKHAYGASK